MAKLIRGNFNIKNRILRRPWCLTVLAAVLLMASVTAFSTSLTPAEASHANTNDVWGSNLIQNPSFEAGGTGWTPQPRGIFMGITNLVSDTGTSSFAIAGIVPPNALGMGGSGTPRPGVQTTNIIPVQAGKQYLFSAQVCRWAGFTGNQWMEITYIDSSGNNVVTLSLNSTDLVPLSNCPNWTQQTMRFNTDFASQLFGVNITGVQLALRVSLDNPGTNGAITSVVFYDDVFFGVRQCGNLSVGSVAPTAPFVASAPTTLYWLEKVGGAHTIKSGNLDGTGVLPVLYAYKANNQPVNWTASGGSPDEAYGFAVDPVAQKIYWTDSGYSPGMKNPSWKHPGRIMRRNLNGTGPTETLICNVQPESIWSMPGPYGEDFAPMGITLDLVNRQMYWTDPGTQTIRRANMDGDPMGSMQILVDQFDIAADTKGVEDILGHNFDPRDIQLDIASGTMYWTDYSGGELHKGIYQTGRIQRSNMNGSGPIQTLVDHNSGSFATGNPPHPHGIALCITCLVPRMFWSDPVENNIMAANLDGSGSIAVFAENVSGASPSASTPQLLIKMPKGVAVDESAGLVYWTNNHSDSSNNNFSIQRRPLNGLGPIQSIVEVNEQPGPVRAIALVQ